MKKLIIIFAMASIVAACENRSNGYEQKNDNLSEARQDGVETETNWDHTQTYVFTGTAYERKNSFDNVSSDLQIKINNLKNRDLDDDVKEKLEEAEEKIQEAREKLAEADEKSFEGNTEDAIEKVDEAREKLDEAREKYIDALEKVSDN